MPIISIAFYMVLIRIAIRRNSKNVHSVSTTKDASGTHAVDPESQDTGYRYLKRPLEVYITQFSLDDCIPPYQDANQRVGGEGGHHVSVDKGESGGTALAM